MSIRQSKNTVFIEGLLEEMGLEEAVIRDQAVIRGTFTVRVEQKVEDEIQVSSIPVHCFSKEMTNAGKLNPSYTSLKQAMETYKSIAAVGEAEADRVRVTGGNMSLNEFYLENGDYRSSMRARAAFVSRVPATNNEPIAYTILEGPILEMGYEVDREGIETDKFQVELGVVNYYGRFEPLTVSTNRPNIAKAIQNTYQAGDTIEVNAHLNFTAETTVFKEEVEIGDAIERKFTRTTSDLIISSVRSVADDLAYTHEEMQEANAKHKEYLEEQKTKSKHSGSEKKAPEKGKGVSRASLGF